MLVFGSMLLLNGWHDAAEPRLGARPLPLVVAPARLDARPPPPPPPRPAPREKTRPAPRAREARRTASPLPARRAAMAAANVKGVRDLDPLAFAVADLDGQGGAGGNGASIFDEASTDVLPQRILAPAPPYPEDARRRGIEGHVDLRVLVDERGAVREVVVVGVSPPSAGVSLEAAARAAAMRWRFQPGRVGARAVACWFRTGVTFRLDD
ncbi:MAG: TonB family protein [Planctomycetes bacterium]|nr:TonB family protein [Planctomycetota bacterium]